MQPTIRLTSEQISFYRREGYLAIPAITTPEEVLKIREIYDRLFSQRVGWERGDRFDLGGSDEKDKEQVLPQLLGPSNYAPELKETLAVANASAIARQLMGEEAHPGGDHAILKPARIGAATPWHQDEAYWGEDQDHDSMSVWIPLQDVNTQNGCMQFIPRSQLLPVQPHHSIGHDPKVHGLEMDVPPKPEEAAICPLPAGGATFHHVRTMHYTGPNKSDEPRRALILIFHGKHKPIAVPRDHYWNKHKHPPREDRLRAAEAAAKGEGK